MVVRLAVRPAVAFEEVPRTQLLVAMSTGEVLRVPSPAQCGDDLPQKRMLKLKHSSLHLCFSDQNKKRRLQSEFRLDPRTLDRLLERTITSDRLNTEH